MHKMPRPSDLMEACPNPTTALLMQHIIYCSRYAKVGRGGFRWFISAHTDWAANTGLSARQVRRSLATLRELGLIVTEQHLHYGRNVTHLRVVHEGVTATGLPEVTAGREPEVTAAGLLRREDQTLDQLKDQKLREAETGDPMQIELPWMKNKAKKMSEVIAENDEKVKKRFSDAGLMEAMDRAEACPSTQNLEKVFQVAWAAGGYGFRPALKKKERGQLTDIVNACASTEVGVYLIVDSVQNWNLLRAHLQQIMKSAQPPELPNPGYIIASIVPVLSWVAKRAKESAMQALAPGAKSDGGGWEKFKK